MVNKEVVTFRGILFRRYPDSRKYEDRNYFRPGIRDRQRGIKALHQEIWIDAYGPIPAGHHIHHVDGNPLNNDISNLECVDPKWHSQHHTDLLTPAERKRRQAAMQIVREKADNWHRSEEGRAWHVEHARRIWQERVPPDRCCDQCGEVFTAFATRGRFCSNKCRAAYRRNSGVDDIERACAWCGGTFSCNRYSKLRFCSRSCSAKNTRHAERLAREA